MQYFSKERQDKEHLNAWLFKAAVFPGLGSQALLLLCHCVCGKHIQEANEIQCALHRTNLEHMQRAGVVRAWGREREALGCCEV